MCLLSSCNFFWVIMHTMWSTRAYVFQVPGVVRTLSSVIFTIKNNQILRHQVNIQNRFKNPTRD